MEFMKSMYTLKKVLIIIFLFVGNNSNAQEIKKTQDLGLWLGASIEYDFKKDYTLSFAQEFRLFESLTEMDRYITDVGLDYKINKNFGIGGGLRYYLERENDKTLSQDWRYNLDFKYKRKIGSGFKIKYRLRYQNVYEGLFEAIYQGSKANVRNKLSLDYKVNKKHTIYVGAELFRKIENYRQPFFNQSRFEIGNEISNSIGKLDLSFCYERELNSNYPLNFFFGRINYTFKYKK